MEIKVWVFVNNKEIVGDEVVLPALPSIGAELCIEDSEGRKRNLIVRHIEMFGTRATDYAKIKPLGGQLDVSVHCDE